MAQNSRASFLDEDSDGVTVGYLLTATPGAANTVAALTAVSSVMLTTDIENLTDSVTGIYSNPESSGRTWGRVAHVEFIGGDEGLDIGPPCGLRIRVFFRAEYGNGRLNFPLFETEGVSEFNKIDFRTVQNYSWSKDGNINQNMFLRDVLAPDLQGKLGRPYTRSRNYHLYLNGFYWGLFMSQERGEANWGESYLGDHGFISLMHDAERAHAALTNGG